MNTEEDNCDTSVLPDDIFTLQGEEFFRVVRSLVGEVISDILKIQLINSAENFLHTSDIFDIFKYDSEDIDEIKSKSCLKMRNGEYIVRIGVLNNMKYLTTVLKKKLEEQHVLSNNLGKEKYYDLINQNPMLQSLIAWYLHSECNNNSDTNHLFTSSFIDTIIKNIVKSKQGYRYDDSMKNFALVLYILGGKQVYEFVRINITGVLPNLTTINKLISSVDGILTEGQFCFDALKQYLNSANVGFGFCAEDCTGIIKKIKYDVNTNSFVGFVTKLSNGVPIPNYYQTDSFEQLEIWFNNIEKSPLLNIHMFQPIPQSNHVNASASFLMSAYGVDSTSTAIDILRRWIYIFNNCSQKQIRIIGFSTDGDSKYVRAMRLMCGFFANLSNFQPHEHPGAFQIKLDRQWPWFFLRSQQLFLFLQDPVHLCTKWRNRLLSETAELRIGNQLISINYLQNIMENNKYTKLDHGLVNSDLNPKDRQNYRSCVKLISEDLLNILNQNMNAQGTHLYLKLLKMIITAYIDKSTPIAKRLELAWCVVFVCRLWRAWLQHTNFANTSKTENKSKYFITRIAYWSVEINAHTLLYLILLVKENHLPKESLLIYLFNSQSCESMFRSTRSLSGAFSTIINFTVTDFLRRSRKLSLLNQIKCQEGNNENKKHLIFPIHHKHKNDNNSVIYAKLDDVYGLDVEQIVSNSYKMAITLIKPLNIIPLLKEHNIFELNSLSKYTFRHLNTRSKVVDNSTINVKNSSNPAMAADDDDDDCDNEDEDDFLDSNYRVIISSDGDNQSLNELSDDDDDEESIKSIKNEFDGINIRDKINMEQENCYFRIKINDTVKYMHKQTACWILTEENGRLSTDRLSRVMQMNKK